MGLPVIRTGNTALDKFLAQVREYIESERTAAAAPGGRGRVLRMSDVEGIVRLATSAASGVQGYSQPQLEKFAEDLFNTRLFKALASPGSALGDAVAGLPRVTLSDVRAARGSANAGVSTQAIVSAGDTRAVAAQVTTVEARLNDVGGATIEEAYLALADAQTGLEAQYTLKVTAGNKFAGIGLAATSPIAGPGTSAIIMVADKFALVGPNESIADPANPPLSRLPFGYDAATNTIYLNGQVRINAGGPTLEDGVQGPPGPKGDTGSPGSPGAQGQRGPTRTVRTISGSSWSDSEANAAVSALGFSKVVRDEVTLRNSAGTWVETRYWDGSQWAALGVVIDGNLLASGSITGNTLAATMSVTGKAFYGGSFWTATSGVAVGFDSADHTFRVKNASGATISRMGLAGNVFGAVGANPGLLVSGNGASAAALEAYNSSQNPAINITGGGFRWAGYTWYEPQGNGRLFLCDNGTWKQPQDVLSRTGGHNISFNWTGTAFEVYVNNIKVL